MFYKFVGGDDTALLDLSDKAVVNGSLKFARALSFNDPFEFKFVSHAPTSRDQFDSWHATHEPHHTAEELSNAWESFSDLAADWNTRLEPRRKILEQFYVLCLAQRWESHLMWGHYSTSHHGFSIRYKPEIIETLKAFPKYVGDGAVAYSDKVPDFHWFTAPPSELIGPILFTKSNEWQYEAEHRVILSDDAKEPALYPSIDPALISGVIFGHSIAVRTH